VELVESAEPPLREMARLLFTTPVGAAGTVQRTRVRPPTAPSKVPGAQLPAGMPLKMQHNWPFPSERKPAPTSVTSVLPLSGPPGGVTASTVRPAGS